MRVMEVTLAQTALRGIGAGADLRAPGAEGDHRRRRRARAVGRPMRWSTSCVAGAGHDEVALREGRRYVNRLVGVPASVDGGLAVEPRPAVVDLGGAGAVRLQIDQPGLLDTLSVHAVRRIPPER